MQHTPECSARSTAAEKVRQAWIEAHPGYCKKCAGWGGTWHSYDPSPAGVSLSSGSMVNFAFCSECICRDKCPWCGGVIERCVGVDKDAEGQACGQYCYYACTVCSWNDDRDREGGLLPYECYCWAGA